MNSFRVASLSTLIVGGFWGLYWIPLRQLDKVAFVGPWSTAIIATFGILCLTPFAWFSWANLRCQNKRGLLSVAVAGGAIALYSIGLLYGHVAVVTISFYLTPIWSSLIAMIWFGAGISGTRVVAIASGVVGIGLVLHDSHGGIPMPRDIGFWLGLGSGILWAFASTGIHIHDRTRPVEASFIFCFGGALTAVVFALLLPVHEAPLTVEADYIAAIVWALSMGAVWWAGAFAILIWANQVLSAPRFGILVMAEVIVAAISASLIAGEPFGWTMGIGIGLVLLAGVLETLPKADIDPASLIRLDD